jgi:eukaryotic-like serine/threonine-protein kinase
VPEYRFGEEIGHGGFGSIRAVTRTDDGWTGVAKVLSPDYSPDELRRFKRETRILAQLAHPNIVPIVGMNFATDPPWFIMPRADANLQEWLRKHPNSDRMRLFIDAALGVEHAHNNGIIHRDLKPANILIFDGGSTSPPTAAVSDFGLGRRLNIDTPTLTPSHAGMGTRGYAAPEQWAEARDVDQRADIYALGVILYELLADQPPRPNVEFGRVPAPFIYLISKATEELPDHRYSNVGAFLHDLELVTRRRADLERPEETALKLIEELTAARTFTADATDPLAKVLSENTDDYRLFIDVVPFIPEAILGALLQEHPSAMRLIVRAYDEHISGPLAYEYCDIAGDFLHILFDMTSDSDIRRTILRRLPLLGSAHNRAHIGDVFARILSDLDEPELLMAVRDVLSENPEAAEWCRDYVGHLSLPAPIREAMSPNSRRMHS